MSVILRMQMPDGSFTDHAALTNKDIQSIAERVCKVLAREVEEDADDFPVDPQMFNPYHRDALLDAIDIITRPRDWAKELSEKEEKK